MATGPQYVVSIIRTKRSERRRAQPYRRLRLADM